MHAGYEVSQIFLYRDHVDFRKSIDGLAAIVEMELRMNIFSGALFLFVNRSRDKMKILYWSRNGFCLWYKRLERERFAWMRGGLRGSLARLVWRSLGGFSRGSISGPQGRISL